MNDSRRQNTMFQTSGSEQSYSNKQVKESDPFQQERDRDRENLEPPPRALAVSGNEADTRHLQLPEPGALSTMSVSAVEHGECHALSERVSGCESESQTGCETLRSLRPFDSATGEGGGFPDVSTQTCIPVCFRMGCQCLRFDMNPPRIRSTLVCILYYVLRTVGIL